MSNVLIGIIGVILFIGLALAGALILGDDFKTANAGSKAAAITSTLQQVSQAANMYQLKRGVVIPSSTANNVTTLLFNAKSLKTAATNPYNGLEIFAVDAGGAHNANRATFLYTNVGFTGDEAAKRICLSIEESAGAANPLDVTTARPFLTKTTSDPRIGCVLNSGYTPALYQAYIPI
jgi:hypothetical protein